jgi:predicted metalloprotease
MRWKKGRRSSNVEDRRGQRVGRGVKMGGGVTLLVVLAVLLLGGDPSALLQMAGESSTTRTRAPTAAEDEMADFVTVVLGSTEDTWSEIFAAAGQSYREPTLVLFTDMVQSACGMSTAATGPFYCPPDQKVYIDVGFFRELARIGGAGDFAQAYVVGHEVGHHVQNLVGTSNAVRQAQARSGSRAEANSLSVAMELQADCYAGVWAHQVNRRGGEVVLEPGDVEEGLRAAAAIGDDRLMRSAGKAANPESFTHGSSEQRAMWLRRGLETGSVEACDTFGQ